MKCAKPGLAIGSLEHAKNKTDAKVAEWLYHYSMLICLYMGRTTSVFHVFFVQAIRRHLQVYKQFCAVISQFGESTVQVFINEE